jgi:hypothetical protein
MVAQKAKAPKLLRRYTELSAAIDLLLKRRIVFLNPDLWDDKNDSHFIRKYREEKAATAVLAICLSSIGETYHHWRVFCGHSSGVCIEFLRSELVSLAKKKPGVRCGSVKYMTQRTIEQKIARGNLNLARLPFVKRHAFRHEKEFRLIYETGDASDLGKNAHYVEMPLALIHGIRLSPWMPSPLFEATRTVLNRIKGCGRIKITQSALIENERWKRNADTFRS